MFILPLSYGFNFPLKAENKVQWPNIERQKRKEGTRGRQSRTVTRTVTSHPAPLISLRKGRSQRPNFHGFWILY